MLIRGGCAPPDRPHNLAGAARALGLTRPQLSYRLQRMRERAKD